MTENDTAFNYFCFTIFIIEIMLLLIIQIQYNVNTGNHQTAFFNC